MLKANALFSVVAISLLIGFFVFTLIIMAYYQRLQVQKDLIIKKLTLNCNSGINILMSIDNDLPYNEPKIIDLYGDETDSVILKKNHWGIFDIAIVKAMSGKHQKIKSVLYGYKRDHISNSAIYLTDQNRPLSLGGATYIKGDCYLPEAGVKRAYIEGQPFSGKNLINGTTKLSTYSLPEINKDVIKNLIPVFGSSEETLRKRFGNEHSENNTDSRRSKDKTFSMEDGGNSRIMVDDEGNLYEIEISNSEEAMEDSKNALKEVNVSFFETPLLVYKKGILLLKEKKYSGNIILCSDQLVIIDSSAKLENVMVFAPSIVVNDYFSGNVQLFATDSVSVGEHCRFLYPSVIGLFKKDFSVHRPFIKVKTKSSFKGIIFTYQEVYDIQETLVHIEKDVLIEGQIYAQGFLDFQGEMWGNVTCTKFMLRTPSSTYENYLLNATIDNSRLSPHFLGSSLLTSKKQKGIITWLE
jgi:hypothetical protein